MALTSARCATPMFFAIRVAPPAQATSSPDTISCRTEYVAPALMPSVMRIRRASGFEIQVADDHGVDRRVLELIRDVEDRTPPGHASRIANRVLADVRPLVGDHDLDLDAERLEALGLSPIAGPRARTSGPPSLPRTRAQAFKSSAPMTPTGIPLMLNTADGVTQSGNSPVASSMMFVARNGSSPAPGASGVVRPRSRTRGCRRTWRPGPTRSRRRSPACPRATPSSVASADVVAAGQNRPTREARQLLVEHRGERSGATHVGRQSVAGQHRLIELAVEVVETDDRDRHIGVAALDDPEQNAALAVLRLGDPEHERASGPGRSSGP